MNVTKAHRSCNSIAITAKFNENGQIRGQALIHLMQYAVVNLT